MEADGVAEAVFGFCLDSIAAKRVPASVKATLFDKVNDLTILDVFFFRFLYSQPSEVLA